MRLYLTITNQGVDWIARTARRFGASLPSI